MQDEKKTTYTAAKKRANERYIAEKTDTIKAALPKGYGEKLHKIAEKAGTSKAQVLKNAIDLIYSEMFGSE